MEKSAPNGNSSPSGFRVRRARPAEAARLSEIAHAAKRQWGYTEDLMALWDASLTLTPDYISHHLVRCAVDDKRIGGFYALANEGEIFELEHLWVDPSCVRKGVGSVLFTHAVESVRLLGGSRLRIVSDPFAEGFYLRMGAERVGDVPSEPKGRMLPLLMHRVT